MTEENEYENPEAREAAAEAYTIVMKAMLDVAQQGRHPLIILAWEPLLHMLASVAGEKIGFALMFASDKLDDKQNLTIVSVPVGVTQKELEDTMKDIVEKFAPFVSRDETIVELQAGWAKCENCVEAHPVVRNVVMKTSYLVTYSEDEEDEAESTGEVKDYVPPGMN